MGVVLENIKKSFVEVRKDISDLKDKMSAIEKELGVLTGKISSMENLWPRK